MTDADRIEFLTNQLRYYRELSIRLNQQVQSYKNVPEAHFGKGLHADPVGNLVAHRIDNQRKKRN